MSTREPSILDLNNDILVLICQTLDEEFDGVPPHLRLQTPPDTLSSLKAFSVTCKRLRELAAPFLFDNIKLGRSKWTWDDVRGALLAMDRCEATKRHAKRFSMSLYIDDNQTCALPEEILFLKLGQLLQSMQKLEKLSFVGMCAGDRHLEIIQSAVEKSNVEFGSVKTLAVPCKMSFMVPKCPNVRCLDVRSPSGFGHSPIDAISYTSGLKHLECRVFWGPEDLDRIQKLVPDLETLAMQSSRPRYTQPIYNFLHTLSSFPNLRSLALAPIGYLNVGFSAPRCGNALRGPGGGTLRERLKNDRERLSGQVANAVFGSCKKLEELWIGEGLNSRATCVRGEDGAVKEIQWHSGQRSVPIDRD